MPEREVLYCTTEDGVRIAYCVEGEGPAVIYVPSFVDSFLARLSYPFLGDFLPAIGSGRSFVHFDHRGVGLSQLDVSDISLAAHVRDIQAVVLAIGVPTVSLLAANLAGPPALAYAATHADRVTHVVLLETYAHVLEVVTAEQVAGLAHLCRTNWHLAAQAFADMSASAREQFADFTFQVAKGIEQSTSGEHMARLIEEGQTWDGAAFFDSIVAETLVLHRKGDPTIPFSAGQRLASGMPGARLVPLEGSLTYPFLGETDWVSVQAIDEFLPRKEGASRARSTDASLRTVLFTDLVGHTEMMQRLGDERGRAVLREHERITRGVLKQYDGSEVKTMGDGFMASFGSVTRAVECAIALQRAFAAWNRGEGRGPGPWPMALESLLVRVGLNAGEPIAEDNDLFGATVILASRIAAQAGAGEILVPDTVRGLCSGKGFLFTDRDEFVPKGFDEAVRLYEVRWRDTQS